MGQDYLFFPMTKKMITPMTMSRSAVPNAAPLLKLSTAGIYPALLAARSFSGAGEGGDE